MHALTENMFIQTFQQTSTIFVKCKPLSLFNPFYGQDIYETPNLLYKEKENDLTQSYGKLHYTNVKLKR